MTYDQFLQLLQTADETISINNARLLREAIEDLKDFGQSIGHEQTGAMIASMYVTGPFAVGNGILEASFQSGASYAEYEVAKGGDHDWATRTIIEDTPRIVQLATEVENVVIKALLGGS
jgi:hypothetical protein